MEVHSLGTTRNSLTRLRRSKVWPLVSFLSILLVVYGICWVSYEWWYIPHYKALFPIGTDPFSLWVADHAALWLQLFGYAGSAFASTTGFGAYVAIGGVEQVVVVPSCSGAKNLFVLLALLLAFPGPIRKKLWYIPAAILVYHLSNALRVALLALVQAGALQGYFSVIKPVSSYVTHIALFGIFMLWVHLSSRKSSGTGISGSVST